MSGFIRGTLFAACVLAVVTSASAAEDPVTPASAKGVQVISVEQAQQLAGEARFFDMRSAVNYGRGHIKGAVALPYHQKSGKSVGFDASMDKFAMAKLPGDKALPIVFYSSGPTGWKSYKAAVVAARAGYSNVKWMREGTVGWAAKGLPLE